MQKVAMWPTRSEVGLSFKGCVRHTHPSQSLSLKEIIRRFVRRESLPVGAREGVYETRFGDLEKISRMDIFDQMEKVAELKAQIAAFEKEQKEKLDAQAKKDQQDAQGQGSAQQVPAPGSSAANAAAPQGSPPVGKPA